MKNTIKYSIKYSLTSKKMTGVIRVPNIENYMQEIINGELIISPKKIYITENELGMTGLTGSKIEECLIKKREEIISTKTNYRGIVVDIWKSMPTEKIRETSTYNIKSTNENGFKGYNWSADLNMSFPDKNANGACKEIIKMVKVNHMSIKISIKLETGRIVHFKID